MRLIDADKAISDYAHYGISHSYDAYDLENILTECPTIEVIPKAEYEARLKADMVNMLEKLKLEIKELWNSHYDIWLNSQYYIGKYDTLGEVNEVIQQKIDALKESEDNNAESPYSNN